MSGLSRYMAALGLLAALLAGCRDSSGEGQNRAPDAAPVKAVTLSETSVIAGFAGSDPDGDALTFTLSQTPANGSVTLAGDTYRYTPNPGFIGADRFDYSVSDGKASTGSTAEVEVLARAALAYPDLATVCRGLEPGLAPLCDAMDSVSTQLVDSCESMADAGFCSTFGGNLHGLADGCVEFSPAPQPLCAFVDTALAGLAAFCRRLPAPPEFCALLDGELIAERQLQLYEQSSVHRALLQQYELNAAQPLNDALFPATHNSFNWTNANTPPTLSGNDPNQRYSMVDQLRLDIRGLELDVHWFPSLTGGGFAPILCHGNTAHFGCTTERPVAEGLREIRGWLEAHPGQVIVIDLQEQLSEAQDDASQSFPVTAAVFEQEWGKDSSRDLIYRPGDHGKTCADGIPLDVSVEDIRAAGRQIVIYTTGCDRDPVWAGLIHGQNGREQDSAAGIGAGAADFVYPQCYFERELYDSSWVRFFEDSTFVGAATGAGPEITPALLREMVRCGAQMPSLDMLRPDKPQLQNFVWSWAPGQPLTSHTQNCAMHNAEGFFQAEACTLHARHACRRNGVWQISTAAGGWDAGSASCAALGGEFAVPRNGLSNELLKEAKAAAGAALVWLNYRDAKLEGQWLAGGP